MSAQKLSPAARALLDFARSRELVKNEKIEGEKKHVKN